MVVVGVPGRRTNTAQTYPASTWFFGAITVLPAALRLLLDPPVLLHIVAGLRLDLRGLLIDLCGLFADLLVLLHSVAELRLDLFGLLRDLFGLRLDLFGLLRDLLGLRLQRPDQLHDQLVHVERLHALDALKHFGGAQVARRGTSTGLCCGSAAASTTNTRGGMGGFLDTGLVSVSVLSVLAGWVVCALARFLFLCSVHKNTRRGVCMN